MEPDTELEGNKTRSKPRKQGPAMFIFWVTLVAFEKPNTKSI
jgi:hypothetical protein